MTPAIQIGPFAFPTELLLLVVAAGCGLLAAGLADRLAAAPDGRKPDSGAVLWRALIVGLVAARLVFVWQYPRISSSIRCACWTCTTAAGPAWPGWARPRPTRWSRRCAARPRGPRCWARWRWPTWYG